MTSIVLLYKQGNIECMQRASLLHILQKLRLCAAVNVNYEVYLLHC